MDLVGLVTVDLGTYGWRQPMAEHGFLAVQEAVERVHGTPWHIGRCSGCFDLACNGEVAADCNEHHPGSVLGYSKVASVDLHRLDEVPRPSSLKPCSF
jgi:hypothetical protein